MQKVVKQTYNTIEHLDAPSVSQQPQPVPTQQPQPAPGGQQAQPAQAAQQPQPVPAQQPQPAPGGQQAQPAQAQPAQAAPVSVVSSNPTPSIFRLPPSGPVICPVGAGSGSGISQLCNCPADTLIQASVINKNITYWCKPID